MPLVRSAGIGGGAVLRGFGGGFQVGVCCGQIQDHRIGGGTAADDAKALVFIEDLGSVGPFNPEVDPSSAGGTRLSRRGTQQRPADSATGREATTPMLSLGTSGVTNPYPGSWAGISRSQAAPIGTPEASAIPPWSELAPKPGHLTRRFTPTRLPPGGRG